VEAGCVSPPHLRHRAWTHCTALRHHVNRAVAAWSDAHPHFRDVMDERPERVRFRMLPRLLVRLGVRPDDDYAASEAWKVVRQQVMVRSQRVAALRLACPRCAAVGDLRTRGELSMTRSVGQLRLAHLRAAFAVRRELPRWRSWQDVHGAPSCAARRIAGRVCSVAEPVARVLGDWTLRLPRKFTATGNVADFGGKTCHPFIRDQHRLCASWWRALGTIGLRTDDPTVVARDDFGRLRDAHDAVAGALALPTAWTGTPSPRVLFRLLHACVRGDDMHGPHGVAVLLLIMAVLVNMATPRAAREYVARGGNENPVMRVRSQESLRVRTWGPLTALAIRGTPGTRPASCARCDRGAHTLRRCAACGVAAYCSRRCQKLAWRSNHRFVCRLWRVAAGKNTATRHAAWQEMHG